LQRNPDQRQATNNVGEYGDHVDDCSPLTRCGNWDNGLGHNVNNNADKIEANCDSGKAVDLMNQPIKLSGE
jgi:hypothetical protein